MLVDGLFDCCSFECGAKKKNVGVGVVVGFGPSGSLCAGPPCAGPLALDHPTPHRPKFRSFFPLHPQLSFFLLSLGVLSWNFGGF